MDVEKEKNGHAVKASRAVNNESVQVIIRCRPINPKEEAAECSSVVSVFAQRGVIEVENPKAKTECERNKIFTYDGVYDWNSTQQNIYDETIRPLVTSVLDGYNGCVFAYGQTGTGKTFTMEGVDDDEDKGVIPRAFDQIWSHIHRTTGQEFLVSVRYLEIYMEEIRDLLKTKNSKSKPLELREMSGQGVFVSHLHSQTCQSANDMLKAMKIGNHNRTTGATNMNEHSSRSHAIFAISIEMAQPDAKSVKVGKLNLVDLAGSERQSKTGATGNRLKEASKINQSLSALGNVIYALAENAAHIPYRDSKLTRLLQDSLGGNSKTIMIANIGPASMNYDETIITLRYAYRAKSIKNQPIKNEDIKDAKLLELQQEIERLKELILEKGDGRTIPEDLGGDDELEEFSSDSGEETEKQKREREKQIEMGKMQLDELGKKLRSLEKQMVHGGKNIIDSVNENEVILEKHQSEIASRKKREVEMQQQLELQEESCLELKQVFQTLQQEVDFKREKLIRLHGKLESGRQEIEDNHDNYIKERQELAEANDDITMQLRQTFLILENFVPSEERSRLLNLSQFNENTDNWVLKKEKRRFKPTDRPKAHDYRRPISEYTISHGIPSAGVRYRGENILDLKLDMPLRTTLDYAKPSVCPQVKAAVKNVIKQDLDNNRIVVKVPPHGFGMRGVSKSELEGRYNKAAKNLVEVNNYKIKQVPKSAKSVY